MTTLDIKKLREESIKNSVGEPAENTYQRLYDRNVDWRRSIEEFGSFEIELFNGDILQVYKESRLGGDVIYVRQWTNTKDGPAILSTVCGYNLNVYLDTITVEDWHDNEWACYYRVGIAQEQKVRIVGD